MSRRLLKSKVDVEVRCRHEIVICSLSIMKSRDISKGTWWIGSRSEERRVGKECW